jgi:acyl dehydratase
MNLNKVLGSKFAPVQHTYCKKDTILYALGLAIGNDPIDPGQLKYVYEKDLAVLPSLCNVLASPGLWLSDPKFEVDWVHMLHGDQRFIVHSPLPAEGSVSGQLRVIGVEDKGPAKGALVFFEKVLSDQATGKKLCTVQTTGFLRADGGCGSGGEKLPALEPLPEREPDVSLELPTYPQSALLYRLSADMNPLHVDPLIAAKAGFERPVLHGLCTMGVACFGLIRLFCGGDAERLAAMGMRFSNPVYPGETIRVEGWKTDRSIRFRAYAVERKLLVLDRGAAEISV